MTTKSRVLIAALFLTPVLAWAYSQIEIDADLEDCLKGSSMDVEISIANETFDFSPSCSFSFDEEIKTAEGLTCQVKAGMCSSFSPKRQIKVECDDGSDEETDIACPVDDFHLDIEVDRDACTGDLRDEAKITVNTEFSEEHDFSLRCTDRLDEEFKTESGDTCRIRSNMCSGSNEKGEIEVECVGGAEEKIEFDCAIE